MLIAQDMVREGKYYEEEFQVDSKRSILIQPVGSKALIRAQELSMANTPVYTNENGEVVQKEIDGSIYFRNQINSKLHIISVGMKSPNWTADRIEEYFSLEEMTKIVNRILELTGASQSDEEVTAFRKE